MITKDIKISRLLNDYPEMIEVLVKLNPHFTKLRNKVLRNALAGRVTVEQAASVAGLPLGKFLAELNSAAGFNPESPSPESADTEDIHTADKPLYLEKLSTGKFIHFDVRPVIESAKDPLKQILAKVKELKQDEVLVIINSFEPLPLYSLLEKKGFSHWTQKEDTYFMVYFYRENLKAVVSETSSGSMAGFDESRYENIIEIDVHELQPPEPMLKILESLNRVDDKTLLLVHHHREPVLLYPKLDERGYRAHCEKLGEDSYKILIGKKEQ